MHYKQICAQYTEQPIKNSFDPAKVYYTESTTSTMEDARSFAALGAVHGTVVCAGFQSRGRGRFRERKWQANPGKNLLFTILLKKKSLCFPFATLPVRTGLALALFCETYPGFAPYIKWPNDMLYNSKKFAGILCEGDNENLYCGIGINCAHTAFSGDLERTAISLSEITGKEQNPLDLCEPVLSALWKVFSQVQPGGDRWHEEVTKRLYRRGEKVQIFKSEKIRSMQRDSGRGVKKGDVKEPEKNLRGLVVEGLLAGIDEDGALLILENGEEKPVRVISGEVMFVESKSDHG